MSFVFAVVHPTSQSWAKADVARAHPELRPAYSRPGLATWKTDVASESIALATPFARVCGRGVGTRASIEEIIATARDEAAGGKLRLHVFGRDARDGEGPTTDDAARARRTERELRERERELFHDGSRARDGERVLDVIVGGEDPAYVGVHVQGERSIPWPGGRFGIEMPEDSPSRAYLKLEEMLAWSGLTPRAGDVAIELGAAPGGAAYALARRGVRVIGIDPAAIDPRVLAFVGPGGARVEHLAKPAGGVQKDHLPSEGARWLLMDVNLAPPVAIRYLERLAAKVAGWDALIVTLKINDNSIARALPELVARVGAIAGDVGVRAIQLGAHRREIGVVARRGKGAVTTRREAPSKARAPARGAGARAGRGSQGGAPPRAPRTR